ncbi:uncharacterized protein SPSK_00583 [Sporothrix schenckii 1099-18]|uniref:Uncharacterized protein n=1 Tax=Sporothrix schenckii 1099-18 TaxID=1397361 RepID=A0A0F2LVS3_SPOSC|nr:uncharacterized protein SPSK_00583 [Sporothrix schenckii 1099-18]KJR79991.1 hypothetical protein SPSK_00583 [Sporothrix schenckii 1099-18]
MAPGVLLRRNEVGEEESESETACPTSKGGVGGVMDEQDKEERSGQSGRSGREVNAGRCLVYLAVARRGKNGRRTKNRSRRRWLQPVGTEKKNTKEGKNDPGKRQWLLPWRERRKETKVKSSNEPRPRMEAGASRRKECLGGERVGWMGISKTRKEGKGGDELARHEMKMPDGVNKNSCAPGHSVHLYSLLLSRPQFNRIGFLFASPFGLQKSGRAGSFFCIRDKPKRTVMARPQRRDGGGQARPGRARPGVLAIY